MLRFGGWDAGRERGREVSSWVVVAYTRLQEGVMCSSLMDEAGENGVGGSHIPGAPIYTVLWYSWSQAHIKRRAAAMEEVIGS